MSEMFQSTEPFVGYRAFRTSPYLVEQLSSVAIQGYWWSRGKNTAECNGRAHPPNRRRSPQEDCLCGFHAYGSLAGVLREVEPQHIIASVIGWGKVIEHSDGWRSQFARITAIVQHSARFPTASLQPFAGHYGVPVVSCDNIEVVASEFGQTMEVDPRAVGTPYTARQRSSPTFVSKMTYAQTRVASGEELLRGRATRRLANNTYARQEGPNVVIRLHNTDVVTIHDDGSRTLNSGGWHTITTKDRLERYGAVIHSVKGKWIVTHRGITYPFYDGMIVRP